MLKVQCKKAADLLPITVPHTKERMELLAKASSYGQKFFATGGTHVTEDYFFCDEEVPVWDAKIKVMEVRKIECARLEKVVEEGKAVLELGKPISALLKSELTKLLEWYTGETDKQKGLKLEKETNWRAIAMNMDAIPLLYEQWTPELESDLQVLKEKDIKIGDTDFAWSVVVKKMELSASADHYTRE